MKPTRCAVQRSVNPAGASPAPAKERVAPKEREIQFLSYVSNCLTLGEPAWNCTQLETPALLVNSESKLAVSARCRADLSSRAVSPGRSRPSTDSLEALR